MQQALFGNVLQSVTSHALNVPLQKYVMINANQTAASDVHNPCSEKRDDIERSACCLPTGRPLDPTVVTVDSEHIHAQLHGWRTSDGGLILTQPITASVAYTPALAK